MAMNLSMFLISSFLFALIKCKVQEITGQNAIVAECSILDGNYGNCTYSVGFFTNSVVSYEAEATVLINGFGQPFNFEVTGVAPYYYNFDVSSGDEIVVEFQPQVDNAEKTFSVFPLPNGSGTAISTSTARTFEVLNQCSGSCTYVLERASSAASWGDTFSITVFVNTVQIGTFTVPRGTLPFSVNAGDTITFQLGPGTTEPVGNAKARVKDQETSDIILTWISRAYYSPLISANPCTLIGFPSPPFGRNFYPITSEQIFEFSTSIAASRSTRWI